MARLAVRYYCLYSLLIYSFRRNISASALTNVQFYSDIACHNLLYTVQTDTNAGSGPCNPSTGNPVTGVNGVRPEQNSDCFVSVYSDNSCGSSVATFAPFGKCTSTTIGSYSVDCMGNGSYTGNYTTIYPSSESNPLTRTISSSSSLAASLLSQSSSASSTDATLPSSSPSQAPKQGDSNGALIRLGRVGLGASLGSLLAICVVVIYLYKIKRAPQSGSPNGDAYANGPNQQGSHIRNPETGRLRNGNIHQSDQFLSANSSFPSLPAEPQPGL